MWGLFKQLQPAWAQRMEKRLMAKIDDELKAIKANMATIASNVLNIAGDITTLKAKIDELLQNPAASPEQAALIDELATLSQGLVDKTGEIAALVPDAPAPVDGGAPAGGDTAAKS